MMFDIVALGELLCDMLETDERTYRAYVGGAPANVTVMASRLGKKCAYIGKVGSDSFGKLIINTLKENGVVTDSIVTSKNYPTTLAFVNTKSDRTSRFSFYRDHTADVMLAPEHVHDDILKDCRIFHFGGLSLKDEPARSATFLAIDYAKQNRAVISFDPNYREGLWPDKADAIRTIIDVIPEVSIFKCSEEELLLLTGEDQVEVGAKVIKSLGPQLVIVTLAERGAYYLFQNDEGFVEAPDFEKIDATGAGDAFMGTFLSELLDGTELPQAIRRSTQAGSFTITHFGAIEAMPQAGDI